MKGCFGIISREEPTLTLVAHAATVYVGFLTSNIRCGIGSSSKEDEGCYGSWAE